MQRNVLTARQLASGASRGRDGHVPGGGWFCFQMSVVVPVLMGAYMPVDVVEYAMLQTVSNKSIILMMAVSWCGQESNMVVGRLLCIWHAH